MSMNLHVFRSSVEGRKICLTDTRDVSKMPQLEKGRWIFVETIDSKLKSFGYGFDLAQANKTVQAQGYFCHHQDRILRPG